MRISPVVLSLVVSLGFSCYAEEPKEERIANFAARRNILMEAMPWQIRSDLNYMAKLADAGLLTDAAAADCDATGTAFAALIQEYVRVYDIIKKAENEKVSQEELDRLTKFPIMEITNKGLGLAGRVNKAFGTDLPTASKRWQRYNDEPLRPDVKGKLNALAILADKDAAMPAETVKTLDADLRHLYDLHVSMNGCTTHEEMTARHDEYVAMLNRVNRYVASVYSGLPASPRWKEWEKKAKENK